MNRCPICHARINDNTCGRCGTDLTLLLRVTKEANQWLEQACYHFFNGNTEEAKRCAHYSKALCYTPIAARLMAFLEGIAQA